jgi:hypothetical protein
MSFTVLEADVRRAWAALRFVDAMTHRTIDAPLAVDLPGARLRRNPRGLWVVLALDAAPGDADGAAAIDAYENAFSPVPAPPPRSLTGRVADPQGRFLARRFALTLPRQPAATPFAVVEVVLDPAPAQPLLSTWAALRLSITRAGLPAPQAAIRVRSPLSDLANPDDPVTVLGRGMTDGRGEALVAVVGVAQVRPGLDELVVEREIAVEIVVSVDTGLAAGALVDPDVLAEVADPPLGLGIARLTVARTIASGRIDHLALNLP